MSDETISPPAAPNQGGEPVGTGEAPAFEWRIAAGLDSLPPQAGGEVNGESAAPAGFPLSFSPEPAAPAVFPLSSTPEPPAPAVFPLSSTPEPAGPGAAALTLERRSHQQVRSTGILDWIALVLAFLAAPLGVLVAIAALVLGLRTKGWASGVAKAALAIGIVVSLLLGAGLFVLNNVAQQQAAHDAIVAGSRQYCAQLRSDPGRLQSPTYHWPGVQDTVADSIAAMQKYEDAWKQLVTIAPDGIRAGTQQVATAAQTIITNVTTSRVLDDANNVAQMQQTVASSGIGNWVAQYCQ